jgi:tRNA/tmRNA/rRNA uracil-C5-methylase (TrmA/RlmC/RlmD family)
VTLPPGLPTLRARVEKLAPTGEGLLRTIQGVGLVDGVLPGEDVEVDLETIRVSSKIWRGRPAAVLSRSPALATGAHAEGCPACDWAHVDMAAARDFKRELFLETMRRIGRLPEEFFGSLGALSIVPSPPAYRLRSRFHAASSERDGRVVVGAFAPGTHRVEPLEGCEALSPSLRERLPAIGDALTAAGVTGSSELSTVESLDASRRIARLTLALPSAPGGRDGAHRGGLASRAAAALEPLFDGVEVVDSSGRTPTLHRGGETRLWLLVGPGGREVPAVPDAFFQANRFLVEPLASHVRDLAADIPAGRALDAFGGSGLFAASLLDAGHSVTSVEGGAIGADSARLARDRWRAARTWRVERSPVLDFAVRDRKREDVIVADPPRAGLGSTLAKALASRTRRRFVYVSCDPATLARDLGILTASGFEIRSARLFDLFALTHRVEAVVCLDRISPDRVSHDRGA